MDTIEKVGAGILGATAAVALAPELAVFAPEAAALAPELFEGAQTATNVAYGAIGGAGALSTESKINTLEDTEQEQLSAEQELAANVMSMRGSAQTPTFARRPQMGRMVSVPSAHQAQVSVYKAPVPGSDSSSDESEVYIAYQGQPISYFDNINQQRGETLQAQAEHAISVLKQNGLYQNAKRVYHISGGSKIGDHVATQMAATHNEVPTRVFK